MSNRVTLAELERLSAEDLARIPVDQLAELQDDVAAYKAKGRIYDDTLHRALCLRYAEPANALRREQNKDTGLVHVPDGEFDVEADLPKTIEWNADGLAGVAADLEKSGEDPDEYLIVKRSVSERAYAAWPKSLRSMVDPHRTIKPGKPSFKLKRKGAV